MDGLPRAGAGLGLREQGEVVDGLDRPADHERLPEQLVA
jgi:hypothetical protein